MKISSYFGFFLGLSVLLSSFIYPLFSDDVVIGGYRGAAQIVKVSDEPMKFWLWVIFFGIMGIILIVASIERKDKFKEYKK